MSIAMLGGLFSSIKQIFMEIFNFIPKIIYLLYASLACVIDVLQLFFRKLAGLDVYYVDGNVRTGDLVTNFIGGILGFTSDGFSYSALSTVFWAFVVFGIIMVFMTTFVAIIKSHYSYDDKAAKGPMQYVYTGVKAIINIAAVPIIVFLGLYVSQAILTALDSISSTSSGTVVAAFGETTDSQGKTISVASRDLRSTKTLTGQTTYVYYDVFGYGSSITYSARTPSDVSESDLALTASANVTFSGSIFKLAAFNGNRARSGEYSVGGGFTGGGGASDSSGLKLFQSATTDDKLADLIDTAFASNLHLKDSYTLTYGGDAISWIKYITGFRTRKFNSFSKFNIGLVWYYYDLWSFNFIVGFAACIICTSLFLNIIMGLITRIFMCIGLFLVAPPLFGLAPLDGGKAAKNWQENFIKQALMAYGSVVGMNLFLIILPFMNYIDFFNIAIADLLAQTLIIITGLVSIKAFIAMLSGLIGAADANATGNDIKTEVGQVAGKAVGMTVGAAKLAAKAPIVAGKMGVAAVKGAVHAGKTVGKAAATAGTAIATGATALATGATALWGTGQKAVTGMLKKGAKANADRAQQNLDNLQGADLQNRFIDHVGKKKGWTANNLDETKFRKEAKKFGLTDEQANTAWDSAKSAAYWQRATGHGGAAIDTNAMRTEMLTRDKNYATQHKATKGFNDAEVVKRTTNYTNTIHKETNNEARFSRWNANSYNATRATARATGAVGKTTGALGKSTGESAVDFAVGAKNKKTGKRDGGVWGNIIKPGSEYAFNPAKNFMHGVEHEPPKKGESPWKHAKSGYGATSGK